jgi:hypothetical protein
MRIMRHLPLHALCFFIVAACASAEPEERQAVPIAAAIARALGCGPDEMAFCVETICEFSDYYCTNREEALGTIR